MTEFEWDEAKRAVNIAKHGVDFSLVRRVDLASARVEPDLRHDYGEDRFQASVRIDDRLYIFVFTYRGDAIRVISFRKANDREILRYETKSSVDPSDS